MNIKKKQKKKKKITTIITIIGRRGGEMTGLTGRVYHGWRDGDEPRAQDQKTETESNIQ